MSGAMSAKMRGVYLPGKSVESMGMLHTQQEGC